MIPQLSHAFGFPAMQPKALGLLHEVQLWEGAPAIRQQRSFHDNNGAQLEKLRFAQQSKAFG